MNTFKTKFGFYTTSKETFLMLKELHKWYWKTLTDFHRWYRWDRKQPQNQVGAKPKYCPMFVLDEQWCRITQGKLRQNVKYFPKTVLDHGIVELFQQARMPHTEEVAVFTNETVARIKKLHAKLVECQVVMKSYGQEVKIAS